MANADRTVRVKIAVDTTEFDEAITRIKEALVELKACGVSACDLPNAVVNVINITGIDHAADVAEAAARGMKAQFAKG